MESTQDGKAFAPGGIGETVIQANKFKTGRLLIGGDQCSSKLQRVRRVERM